ncbi:MAG TPA: DUF6350 family protein [Dermatophilaceae bacterium]|jgi:hypothetical protein|uniref:Uncharacterized protein n=1 Tax=Candidatus Phosphoribacter hodrii TaxID=2953743 RepID=A0A9D7TC93_9MICO|nr:hypothetical protein [Candidatus Phosphoribacter hodrii]HOA02792.1 DUF6350 family protein [Dermatophilaceae bacterium]
MSLLDRVRSTVHASRGTVDALRPQTPTWRVWASGAVAVGVPWLATIGMAVLVWAVTPASDAPWGQVLGIASAGWFLGTGADVAVDGVVVGIVPMLVWGLAAAFTAYQLRRLVAHTDERPLRLLPGFLGGYAAAAALVGLLTLAGPVRPTPAGLLGALSVPLVAAAVVALREDDDLFDRLPQWAARALRPAGWGVVTLAALAAALLLGMLVVRWPTLSSLDAAVGAHGAGEVGLIVGQLLFLPDLLVWALSFIAGPGFQVAAGGTVSVSGAAPGLLPMIPALGVVPSDGLYPAAVTLVLLLPVAAGALVAWHAGRQWSRLARWQDKASTVTCAVVLVDLVVLGAALLASGPAGSARLVHVGPQPWVLAGAMLVELVIGAGLTLAVDVARRRWVG